MKLGRLEKIDLKDIWKTESQHFTPWLALDENISLLGDTIKIDLEVEAVEKNVGPFRADILCKDTATNQWVLIENQIARTDHTHLGQLLTYAAGLNTVSIVWIAERFTDEHRAALDWLNEITGDEISFFGLEIELWKIGESPVAPKFNIVSKPNDWIKPPHNPADLSLTPAKIIQLEYWQSFREYVLENSTTMKPQKAAPQHWMSFGFGTSKAFPHVTVNTVDKSIAIRMQINPGEQRLSIYNLLFEEKEAIEKEAGCKLDWEELPDKRTSYVTLRKPKSDVKQKSNWPEFHKWMLEKLELFRKIFAERIKDMDTSQWIAEES